MHTLIFFTLWLGVALLMGYIGRNKKFGFWGNFAVTLFLTPIVAIVVYFAQSDKSHDCHASDDANTSDDSK